MTDLTLACGHPDTGLLYCPECEKENAMSTEASKTLALHPDWLDGGELTTDENSTSVPTVAAASYNLAGGAAISGGNTIDYGYWQYPTTSSNWYYYTPPKIRLTLTEVQRLRAAAKKDAKLRDALRKFTPHIEIEVDFP